MEPRAPRALWAESTFQSTHESVSRDEPKINGFPVPDGTTPSRGFLEGGVGCWGDRPSGVSGAGDESGWKEAAEVEKGSGWQWRVGAVWVCLSS